MAAQSFAMGQAFGTSFQYGKRKISSMSNEEFNAITAVELADQLQTDVRAMIPAMTESFHRMENFQIDILDSMGRTLIKAIEAFFNLIGPTGFSGTGTGPGGVNPYVGTGELSDDALHEQEQGFPEYLQHAHGSDEGSGDTKFVSDYIAEAKKLPFNLLADIVEKMLSGKLQQPIERMIAYKQVYKERLPDKKPPGDVGEAITKSGATGIVNQIATMYSQLVALMTAFRQAKANTTQKLRARNLWIVAAKKYNQFVAQNRKPNLQVDTALSLRMQTVRPKT